MVNWCKRCANIDAVDVACPGLMPTRTAERAGAAAGCNRAYRGAAGEPPGSQGAGERWCACDGAEGKGKKGYDQVSSAAHIVARRYLTWRGVLAFKSPTKPQPHSSSARDGCSTYTISPE